MTDLMKNGKIVEQKKEIKKGGVALGAVNLG